ncbi:MAG TPA: transglutaminase domain-containing protein [Anaerolineales bacterium]|nr:transglutaminase domain-containing protein [Anaerolineales bacterium]
MIVRILRKALSAEVMGLLLVLLALQLLTSGISASLRNPDTRYFFPVCLISMLIAFSMSKRQANGVVASAVMTLLGAIGVWILGARLSVPFLGVGHELWQLLPQLIPAIRTNIPIDTTGLADAWRAVSETSAALSGRVLVWLRSIDGNVVVNDALVRNMVWLLIVWLLAAWMGWHAARRHAIAVLLPSIVFLAVITSYSERRVDMLWGMVLIMLMLMGIWNYRNHTAQWERKKVDYSDSIVYDLSQTVFLLTLGIGLLAFITPSISWRQIRDYFRERNQNEVAEMLGVKQQQVAVQPASGPKPSLPRDHLLSGGFAQSEEVVMTVRTGELPPISNPALAEEAPRYYWRSTIYDTYMGAGWVTSASFPQNVQPDTPLIPGLLDGYKSLHLDVDMVAPEGKLFWSGILFSADVPFRANWRVRPQTTLFADQATLLEADMFAAVSTATSYRAQSYIPFVSAEELRAASTEYPEAIRGRYLNLPRSVPERVGELARELTQEHSNAYDKAKALEAYLRTYPYDLDVPAPPEDQDVADYFLFQLQKGYCDYYATAMVVLARASGLPARFVSGYASGSYDAANAQYVVRELHAHSWVEIYFPEIGWVEFEPTASQPERELAQRSEVTAPLPDESAERLLYRFRLETLLYWSSPIALILFAAILYFGLIERWLYLRLPPAAAIEKMYRRLYRLGRSLAGEHTRAETAYEYRQKLLDEIRAIEHRSRLKPAFAGVEQDINFLTDCYQDALFRDRTIQKNEIGSAWMTWKRLRLRILLAHLYVIARRVRKAS